MFLPGYGSISTTVHNHLVRGCWMGANVTHGSWCKIHFLNRNRPSCGRGNVFVFPALPYAEQSLNCTASIYQCHIFLCWKRDEFHEHSILFFSSSVETTRFEQQGAVPWKISRSPVFPQFLVLLFAVIPSSSSSPLRRLAHVLYQWLFAWSIWRIHSDSVVYRTQQV